MDELIGKGLGIWMILKLLGLMSTTMVPLAIPLSVLLSSIMTFGNMGENFELVAIKASGISMLRFMQPLGIFVIVVSLFAFVFNNNVIPIANLKALSLLYDVRNSKPTLNIKPDKFNNDIKDFSIRVGSKKEDGFTINDILIYDLSDQVGNNKVVIAREGQMIPTADKKALIFRLTDGWQYEEGFENGTHAVDFPQTRLHFERWDKVFDLSSFILTRNSEDLFKNAYQMMDVQQLSDAIDSLHKTQHNYVTSVSTFISPYVTLYNSTNDGKKLASAFKNATGKLKYKRTILETIDSTKRHAVLENTLNGLRNAKSLLDNNILLDNLQRDNYLRYGIEYHRKFSLSFACFLLFLIGAPLGAIIRKGGLGLPLVFAVSFFITFMMLNISGEKLVKTSSLSPMAGMWMSTAILAPIAIWLIITARNDSKIFTKEWYQKLIRKAKHFFKPKTDALGR